MCAFGPIEGPTAKVPAAAGSQGRRSVLFGGDERRAWLQFEMNAQNSAADEPAGVKAAPRCRTPKVRHSRQPLRSPGRSELCLRTAAQIQGA